MNMNTPFIPKKIIDKFKKDTENMKIVNLSKPIQVYTL